MLYSYPTTGKIKGVETNGCKYLGTLEYDRIKENEMKECLKRTELIMGKRLNGKRNKI